MAVFALTDAVVTVNGVDLSDHVRSVSIDAKVDELDTTAMGSTWHARIGSLKDWSATIEFNQDFAASKVDATVWAALGTVVTVAGTPVSGTVTATNPRYSGSMLVNDYKPIS